MRGYNDESDERYFLEVDLEYPEKLYNLYNDLRNDTKMINFHDVIKEYIKEHNPNWPKISDYP